MSILDDPERWQAADPSAMRALLASFPDQVEEGNLMVRSALLAPLRPIDSIVVTGLGGSAIGGDLIRTAAGELLRVPLIVNRDYRLPGFVGSSTLVVASSYSGNTEETLSAYDDAKHRNAAIVCITTGGRLESLARADGHPVLTIPAGLPPRAALGYSCLALLKALTALDLAPDLSASVDETVVLLRSLLRRYNPEVPEQENIAKQIAVSLHGKLVAIYASCGILEAAAARWRGQIEENAKNLAFHHLLPEMNHNELVGWRYPETLLQHTGVIFLRDRGDHPQVKRRFELTRELIRAKSGAVHEVWSEGESVLARIFSMTYLGDYVSLYLAYLNRIDPTPVEIIDFLKQKLSA